MWPKTRSPGTRYKGPSVATIVLFLCFLFFIVGAIKFVVTVMDASAFFKEHSCSWHSERSVNSVTNPDGSATVTIVDNSKGLICVEK